MIPSPPSPSTLRHRTDAVSASPHLAIPAANQRTAPLDTEVVAKLAATETLLQAMSAVTELATRSVARTTLSESAQFLADEVQHYLGCQRVAIVWRDQPNGVCRLLSVSATKHFDARAEWVRQAEATLEEIVTLSDLTEKKEFTCNSAENPGLRNLAILTGVSTATAFVLSDPQEKICGAVLLLADEAWQQPPTLPQFIRCATDAFGTSLSLVERGGFSWTKLWTNTWQTIRSRSVVIGVTLALLTVGVLAIPVPYRWNCDAEIQPVVRRFIAAPFESRLEKSNVSPGELVKAGDVLARLDGRELRLELGALQADLNRATKERDTALANRNVAASQMALLEMERLQLKANLISQRIDSLEIKSPLAGIVISGDLERAEGAPLSVGQSLFEIAPLEQMVVEVAIPETEIPYAELNSAVSIRLDGTPDQLWDGTILRIHPRAEIHEQENVFIAEVLLENSNGLLRPGMKGTAKLTGPTRTLGWGLFHRAWNAAAAWGW